MIKAALALLAATGHFLAVEGHFRWKYPVPRSNGDNIKQGPCGPGSTFGETGVTEIKPGKLTITFENTIPHTGAPWRLALASVGADGSQNFITAFEDCVLLDHIPSETSPQRMTYRLSVDIPDVSCERCTLQLLNPMTDKITIDSCLYDPANTQGPTGNSPTCGSNYHSCADVKITGTGTFNVQNCKEPSNWPWRTGQPVGNGGSAAPLRYHQNEVAEWATDVDANARYLKAAPEEFHGSGESSGDNDKGNEGDGGSGGKVVLVLFFLALGAGAVYVGVKKPEVYYSIKKSVGLGGEGAPSARRDSSLKEKPVGAVSTQNWRFSKNNETPLPHAPPSKSAGEKLPQHWEAIVDPESGDTYYYNSKTGTTTWDKPQANPAAPPPLPPKPAILAKN